MAVEKAYIDRFEDDIAVLLVGDEQRPVNVPRSSLPEKAKEGHWLQVEFTDGLLTAAQRDKEEEQKRKQQVEELLRDLRGKKGS